MSEHAFDLSDPAIGALIRRKAAKLARLATDQAAGINDCAQDLALALLSRSKNFDASRGEAGAFLHAILKSAVANILRCSRADKRIPPGQPVNPVGSVDPRQSEFDETRDLVMDVQEALARLPEYLREVAIRVVNTDTLAEAARDLGISRGTLYSRLDVIRKRFESRELQKYL